MADCDGQTETWLDTSPGFGTSAGDQSGAHARPLPSGYSGDYLGHYLQFRVEAISGATGVSQLREEYNRSLWLLLGLTALVLVIACANLSNLMLARAGTRAFGSSRSGWLSAPAPAA